MYYQDKTVTLRLSSQELNELKELADQYCGGNLSGWLRYAGVRYIPRQSEMNQVSVWNSENEMDHVAELGSE